MPLHGLGSLPAPQDPLENLTRVEFSLQLAALLKTR